MPMSSVIGLEARAVDRDIRPFQPASFGVTTATGQRLAAEPFRLDLHVAIP